MCKLSKSRDPGRESTTYFVFQTARLITIIPRKSGDNSAHKYPSPHCRWHVVGHKDMSHAWCFPEGNIKLALLKCQGTGRGNVHALFDVNVFFSVRNAFLKILDNEFHCIPNKFCDFSHSCHFPFPTKAQRIEMEEGYHHLAEKVWILSWITLIFYNQFFMWQNVSTV